MPQPAKLPGLAAAGLNPNPSSAKTAGSASGRSSAISPRPIARAAAPCIHTAAAAASYAPIPCASRPAIMPVSTSPAAGCRQGRRRIIGDGARPSGAATTVSGPFSTTMAPESAAASPARSSFDRQRHKTRKHPSELALVRRHHHRLGAAPMALNNRSPAPANDVRPSASSTRPPPKPTPPRPVPPSPLRPPAPGRGRRHSGGRLRGWLSALPGRSSAGA